MRSVALVSMIATLPALTLTSGPVVAQEREALSLGRLHEAAFRHDPRARQAALEESAIERRLRNLASEWLPQPRLRGEARYQSDVPRIEASGTGQGGAGIEFPDVPKERYEVAAGLEQRLYDGGRIAARRDVARAAAIESTAHLEVTLHELHGEVNRAFFGALAFAAREDETDLLIDDLEARLAQARSGVEAGVRLTGEAERLEAELLRARQRLDELEADRRAALAVLEKLTAADLPPDVELTLPDLASEVAAVRGAAEGGRRHPAFDAFEATADRLAEEVELAGRARRPRLLAFGEAGYGRPGLNQFSDAWDTYWLGGVRLEWAPWQWGRIGREQELLDLRRAAVTTEEEAFAAVLDRAVAGDLADLDRLRDAIATDERILQLRERVVRQEGRRFEERAITAADYVVARTDLLEARVVRRLHEIELAETRARYLTTLGIPLP